MEQVCGEVQLKEEGIKTLERVDQRLASTSSHYNDQSKGLKDEKLKSPKSIKVKQLQLSL